jgi:hypothetical protein
MTPRAKDLERLLAARHPADKWVYVAQCKTGPTAYAAHLHIMDAWAFRKSWSHPAAVGYEIKVDRGDFLKDQKWRGYLPYTNQFFFVTPKRLIQPNELPPEAGLMEASTNYLVLLVKKQSVYRDAPILPGVFHYVLMHRAGIKAVEWGEDRGARLRWWKEWLENKGCMAEVGYMVSKTLQVRLSTELDEWRRKASEAEWKARAYDEMAAELKQAGAPTDHYKLRDWLAGQRAVGATREKLVEASRVLNELLGRI